MKQFTVTGMSCAACSARVEKAVGSLQGVSSCSVNLLTNSMNVETDLSDSEIISAVEKAGYGASSKGAADKKADNTNAVEDKETPKIKRRLVASIGFLAVLMYITMGHGMAGLPLPEILTDYPMANALTQLLLSGICLVINQKFFISGFKGLINRAPNMDTLVALGSGASFVWSIIVVYQMSFADTHTAHELLHGLYFESAAMILTLITVGKMLEARSKGKTTDALKSLMDLKPKTATVERDGEEIEVPVSDLAKGDIFILRAGDNVPTDGEIIEGSSALGESTLTGESIPVDKTVGDKVSAGTANLTGYLRCKATAVGEDTVLSQIISMVSDAAATKAPISKIADKVSGVFVPVVMIIAIVTAAIWLIAGQDVAFALARGISVLVISCPCALGLATPVAIMVSSGKGAKNGVLFKTAEAIERSGKIQIVALDKTGTITEGKPKVTDIYPCGISERELLSLAYSLESKSEHPLSKAVTEKAETENIPLASTDNFTTIPGKGLSADVDGATIYGGNRVFVSSLCTVPDEVFGFAKEKASEGKTPLYFCKNDEFIGCIFVRDTVKEDSAEAISQLKNMGIHVVMLTGDNEVTAQAIAGETGVDEVIAGVLPSQKENTIRNLQKRGSTAMVGDGINDAVALTRADLGIAIGAGTDIAVDSADVVLMKSRLSDVPALIRLGRHTLTIIYENLFWAFFYNALGIPLAAGLFISAFGWELNPMFGAAAMSLSSFCVVSNALRLNLVDIRNPKHDHKTRKKLTGTADTQDKSGESEAVIKVKGMMCEHCERRVKECLEVLDGIDIATPDFRTGEVHINHSGTLDMKAIKKAIKDAGYKVI